MWEYEESNIEQAEKLHILKSLDLSRGRIHSMVTI